jgi:hypothetical protein
LPAIERTAYPRFSSIITSSELQQSFTPTDAEQEFAQANTRTSPHAFCFLALLKCFQRLHYFPPLKEIPTVIVDHLRTYLQLHPDMPLAYENERNIYRHCTTIRDYLGFKTFYGKQARHIAVQAVYSEAYGALFSDDAQSVTAPGERLDGRKAIAQKRSSERPHDPCH